MLVELKSGETYNGHLMQCDNYMNLTLREVIQTSRVCACTGGLGSSLKQSSRRGIGSSGCQRSTSEATISNTCVCQRIRLTRYGSGREQTTKQGIVVDSIRTIEVADEGTIKEVAHQ